MDRPRLIAIHAPAQGSGKSTLAKVLRRELAPAHVLGFASTLKSMAVVFLANWLGDGDDACRRVYGDDAAKAEPIPGLGGVTTRQLMQRLGTEWGREQVAADVWVRLAMTKARRLLGQGATVIFDDMRFPNELAAVLAAGGLAVRIERPGVAACGHASERGLATDRWAAEVANGGTLADLEREACRLASNLKGKPIS